MRAFLAVKTPSKVLKVANLHSAIISSRRWRAAWPQVDDKTKPPEPLSEREEKAYFDDHTPTQEEALEFVCTLFSLSGLEVPAHLLSAA
jgi:hypothetical protein